MDPASTRRQPWTTLAAGGALLVLGVVLARASLPEWRTGPIPRPELFADRA